MAFKLGIKLKTLSKESLRRATPYVFQIVKEDSKKKKAKEPIDTIVAYKNIKSNAEKQGGKLETIDISDIEEFGEFTHLMRKYDIDYTIKANMAVKPVEYYLFFNSKDSNRLLNSMKEFGNLDRNGKVKKDIQRLRPSIQKQLEKVIDRSRKLEKSLQRAISRPSEPDGR